MKVNQQFLLLAVKKQFVSDITPTEEDPPESKVMV